MALALAPGGDSIQTSLAWGDCDSPGRSSGDAGAATPQVSAAERRGGVEGGARGAGAPGSLASVFLVPALASLAWQGSLSPLRKGSAVEILAAVTKDPVSSLLAGPWVPKDEKGGLTPDPL